jgi:hypothetical protein
VTWRNPTQHATTAVPRLDRQPGGEETSGQHHLGAPCRRRSLAPRRWPPAAILNHHNSIARPSVPATSDADASGAPVAIPDHRLWASHRADGHVAALCATPSSHYNEWRPHVASTHLPGASSNCNLLEACI